MFDFERYSLISLGSIAQLNRRWFSDHADLENSINKIHLGKTSYQGKLLYIFRMKIDGMRNFLRAYFGPEQNFKVLV